MLMVPISDANPIKTITGAGAGLLTVLMPILLLAAGLVLLVLAGDALVQGAVAAARRLQVPPLIVGLTVVAFGTSAPEFIVSLEAALKGSPGLAIGNVVGSNIANVLLVLGLPAIIAPMALVQDGTRRSTTFMVVSSALLAALVVLAPQISRVEGLGLFTLLIVYLTYSGYAASQQRRNVVPAETEGEEEAKKQLTTAQILMLVGFGVVGLGFGGKLTTEGALDLAHLLGVAESAVGLTIVALGTSLPELATSLAAAFRRQSGVVIGNVIGSNIFNILGILGIIAAIVPLDIDPDIAGFDIWVMLAVSILMLPIVFLTRRLNRYEGIAMTAGYLLYCVAVFRPSLPI